MLLGAFRGGNPLGRIVGVPFAVGRDDRPAAVEIVLDNRKGLAIAGQGKRPDFDRVAPTGAKLSGISQVFPVG